MGVHVSPFQYIWSLVVDEPVGSMLICSQGGVWIKVGTNLWEAKGRQRGYVAHYNNSQMADGINNIRNGTWWLY